MKNLGLIRLLSGLLILLATACGKQPQPSADQTPPDRLAGDRTVSSSSAGMSRSNRDELMASNRQRDRGDLVKISDLVGAEVRNPQGEVLGKIKDLILDGSSGRVLYAIVGTGRRLALREREVPIPLAALDFGGGGQPVLLAASKTLIESAPDWREDAWPTATAWGARPGRNAATGTNPPPRGKASEKP